MDLFNKNCNICNGKADVEFKRIEVWSTDNWRLTASTYKSVKGLCYLESKRHIPYITDLDGQESIEFGSVLSKTTKAIKDVFKSELVYVYIYGGHIPHLHVHLAPHTQNDIFCDNVVKNDDLVGEETLDNSEMASYSLQLQKLLDRFE